MTSPRTFPLHTSVLLSHDPQPSLLLDGQARPIELNPALLKVLAQWPNTDVTALLPVNQFALVRACLEQQRAIEDVEACWEQRIFLWTFIPVPQGNQVLARCREATEQVVAEREAAKARRLYRLITENTTDLISRHTPEGHFIDASPAAWTLLGYWPEELRGLLAQGLFHGQDLAGLINRARDALTQEGYHTMTYRIRHRDGHYLWFETASRAIRETYTGAVVEVVSVSRDITARVQADERQRRLEDELAHTARLVTLGELASGIAHEINQPLAAVVNYASASQRYLQALGTHPQAAERVAQGLEHITDHANRASEVIKRLRAFLRKGRRQMQALDASEVARGVVRLCGWEANDCQVTIKERLPDNLPPIYADRVLLEQVLLNVLRNAIEANREAHPGRSSTIVLAAEVARDGRIELSVQDQGPGVSEPELEKIFTPFYTSKVDGLGLGLSMSRNIIEGLGGELKARRLPVGLMLLCYLPRVGPSATASGVSE
ncbi:PAS domain S-box protein [Pseudomonas sp. CCI3.2]|uniref:sensor histidine kinase n=1 Tax=unclassified Pseudomonas TaxID=196821 RepID=UPI002AC9982E|nr:MULTISPECIES: PAS domain S-box protein [unclassified Pseudomonas]MEB0078298.1 PAS domain S-box protein [Pseudomonas sp. MH10out]MEB0092259.1 PAS domain S-box protein [Pseudomonas sp. CCI4.2]MEB0101752.1 PAS domain S-box protein [Pseudomonas sp. CCI3.2]MEB0132131.1 PAS domain S-box protein [Pseudomonas sp. CCI2.4]MEB0160169.1 PAS domain S-box protein [Pseudomonas sp. AH2 (2023)]